MNSDSLLTRFFVFLAICVFVGAACASGPDTTDLGSAQDEGSTSDVAVSEDVASPPTDEGAPEDLASPPDDSAGTSEDVMAMDDIQVSDTGMPPTDEGMPPTDEGMPPMDEGMPPMDEGMPPMDSSEVPPVVCGGFVGTVCADGAFCELPADMCESADMVGACVVVPEVCTEIFAPVCGCNGKSYINDCMRQKAGAQKASEGNCGDIEPPGDFCGGIAGFPCPDEMFCDQQPGTCQGADMGGSCVVVPEACTDQWEPVCGCDGMTYGNDCERLLAGMNLNHVGECGGGPVEACEKNNDCGPGSFCAKEDGQCLGVGSCMMIPAACTFQYDPVCGCDNETYSNGCVAHASGVNVLSLGSCDVGPPPPPPGVPCGGIVGIPCPGGQFCENPPAMCMVADMGGMCTPMPGICTANYDPVCGCDGVTYSNNCVRQSAGAQLDYPGECESQDF